MRRRQTGLFVVGALLLAVSCVAFLTDGFGANILNSQTSQSVLTGSQSFSVSGATTVQDPGGLTWTDNVSGMIVATTGNGLITLTPSSANISPTIGITTKGVVGTDNTPTLTNINLSGRRHQYS